MHPSIRGVLLGSWMADLLEQLQLKAKWNGQKPIIQQTFRLALLQKLCHTYIVKSCTSCNRWQANRQQMCRLTVSRQCHNGMWCPWQMGGSSFYGHYSNTATQDHRNHSRGRNQLSWSTPECKPFIHQTNKKLKFSARLSQEGQFLNFDSWQILAFTIMTMDHLFPDLQMHLADLRRFCW